ncbi:MAG: hypothetical protein M1G31_23810 [Pseudanabaena sp. Salubria-1]|nr:hypothetical protein [Pseudanabaena sp. Salubria-1]
MKLFQIIINTILSSSILAIGIFAVNWASDSPNAIAQDSSDCFMINSSGRRIDLLRSCTIPERVK